MWKWGIFYYIGFLLILLKVMSDEVMIKMSL